MGKIYRALERSGNQFTPQHISNGALRKEFQITVSEKRALGGNVGVFNEKDIALRANDGIKDSAILEKTETQLMALGLGKDQISKQGLKELNKSLHRIDGYVESPDSFFIEVGADNPDTETNFRLAVLLVILERRMFVLDRINQVVSSSKLLNLRRLTKSISDRNVKSAIEKIINDLQRKDSVFGKEHQRLEKLRLDIYSEQQKFASIWHEFTDFGQPSPKNVQNRASMTTLMTGVLLIVITSSMAAALFMDIPIPLYLNSAFFVILGFFFGQAIRLASKN